MLKEQFSKIPMHCSCNSRPIWGHTGQRIQTFEIPRYVRNSFEIPRYVRNSLTHGSFLTTTAEFQISRHWFDAGEWKIFQL